MPGTAKFKRALTAAAALIIAGCGAWRCQPASGNRVSTQVPGDAPAGAPVAAVGCTGGCATSSHEPLPLSESELRKAFDGVAGRAAGEPSPALETLLFHAPQTRDYLNTMGARLTESQRAFLERELNRSHVQFELRILDEAGVERLRLEPRRVPLRIKQHLHAEHHRNLQPPEISGTLYRVGLDHLWARL
jgi:hypothetical protein